MKNIFKLTSLVLLTTFLSACTDTDVEPLFDQSVNERTEALKAQYLDVLTAPEFGWIGYYSPNKNSGVYTVLTNFDVDGSVLVHSDYDSGSQNKSITYRLDKTLKIELVFETHAVFHEIFEINNNRNAGEFVFNVLSATDDEVILESKLDYGDDITILKVIFDNALQYDVEEIYVTIFNKRDEQLRLIYLLEDWGFKHWGTKTTDNGIEQVFVRECKPAPNLQQPKLTFPAVSKNTTKWIVPIYPQYHTELFPDSILNNESPQDFTENEPYRNAIKKVYISRSYNRNLNGGDLLLFYRTGGHYAGVISTIGVVENVVTNIRDENHFIELCRKRSVFDDAGLKEFWNYRKNNRPFIVNFLYIDSFPMPKVNLKRLRELNIIQDAPRGFEQISDAKFEQILKEARANESYIID